MQPSHATVTFNFGDEYVQVEITWTITQTRCTICVIDHSEDKGPMLTTDVVTKHAATVGNVKVFRGINANSEKYGPWLVEFDRRPNFTQMAMFIEKCFAEVLVVQGSPT